MLSDNERLVAEVRVELRDEKQVRRRVEAEQSRLQETLAEMEAAHTATQKVTHLTTAGCSVLRPYESYNKYLVRIREIVKFSQYRIFSNITFSI